MEQRLIDADALLKYIDENATELRDDPFDGAFDGLKEVIRQFPTIDAVPAVRCNECEYWGAYTDNGKPNGMGHCGHPNILMPTSENFFCGFGKRKEKRNESND